MAARPLGRSGFRKGASLIGAGAGGWTVAPAGRLAWACWRATLKLFVLNRQEAAVPDLVAAPFVRAVNSLASDRIDEVLAEPIAGVPIDLTERDALSCPR